ncbi:MAG: 23S rRNA pseudouridine1911/1915/1917 synthase [Sediminicola sp.]|jgi:23S rRNA pseudouridine1911/1915/1917 synthase
MDSRIRLSDVAAGTFKTILSRKGFKSAIKNGLVTLNGKIAITANYISGGEIIELFQSPLQNNKPTIDLKLEVIFEDDYLAIVYKPAGIVVSGNRKYTLENALEHNLTKSTQEDALLRPEPVHRLDYPTSGLLVIGKVSRALIALNKMFEEKSIQKTYHAITIGVMVDNGVIEKEIESKNAKTSFQVLERIASRKYESLNLIRLTPFTGRKHQLRIHLASIGTPILGDDKYGKEGLIGSGNGLYLHASGLTFIHPISHKKLTNYAPLTKKFLKLFPV